MCLEEMAIDLLVNLFKASYELTLYQKTKTINSKEFNLFISLKLFYRNYWDEYFSRIFDIQISNV